MLELDPRRKRVETLIDDMVDKIKTVYEINKEECSRLLNIILSNLPYYEMKSKREYGPTGPEEQDIRVYMDTMFFGQLTIIDDELIIWYHSETAIPMSNNKKVKIPVEIRIYVKKLITQGIINSVQIEGITKAEDFVNTMRDLTEKIMFEIS